MKLEYVSLASGQRLDTIELAPGRPAAYRTGRARPLVEGIIGRAGESALPGWTNGYVVLREA